MKTFRWNPHKNELLKACRGVSFEDVVLAMETGGLLDMVEHPNSARYPNQGVFVVAISSYVYLVSHVEEEDYIFLKTIIPSRKATPEYGMREGKP
ncbi:MAG: toxin [Nitrospira sp. LK265]|nr:toxin [Nitrospira sp. LK265]